MYLFIAEYIFFLLDLAKRYPLPLEQGYLVITGPGRYEHTGAGNKMIDLMLPWQCLSILF